MEEFLLAIANCFSAKCLQKWLGSRVSASFQRITQFVQLCATYAGGGVLQMGIVMAISTSCRNVPRWLGSRMGVGFHELHATVNPCFTLLIIYFWRDRGV